MSPRSVREEPPSFEDLLLTVTEELEKSVSFPDVRNFEPYDDAQRDYLHCEAFGSLLSAGNRAGKTDVMIVKAILLAANDTRFCNRPQKWGKGPIQIRVVTVDQVKGVYQIMLPKFKRWMSPDMLIDGDWDKSWDDRLQTLTFANGSSIDFLTYGMTVNKFAGLPRHMICFDEEPPREIFNECMARLKDYAGIWTIAATPDDGFEWINDKLIEPYEDGTRSREIVSIFYLDASKNPYLKGEKDGRYNIAMDADEIEVREKGVYKPKGGLVFPELDATKHFVEPRDFVRGSVFYTSVDFGWNNPTCWLWHAVLPNGDIHTFAEHYANKMTPAEHAAIVKVREYAWAQKAPTIFKRDEIIRVGDPAGKQNTANTGTSVIAEYSLVGLDIGVEGIPHDVMIGIEKMQQYFRLRKDGTPRWTVSQNCPNFIRELKKLRWETYESSKISYSKNVRETVHKKDDHSFDSARYFATLMPNPAPDTTPLPGEPKPTLSYEDWLVNASNDPTVEFFDERLHDGSDESGYEVEYEMEDFL